MRRQTTDTVNRDRALINTYETPSERLTLILTNDVKGSIVNSDVTK